MLDDMSPAVERALMVARSRAGDQGLNTVHVFLALIEDEEGRAAQVLCEAGGDLTLLRRLLEEHASLPFDLSATLQGSREAAGERCETTVTGEFLLLGLIRSSEALREPLRRAGVAFDQLAAPIDLPPLPFAEPLAIRDSSDFVSAARVVDANANRACESLRVLDDYCRFVLNDSVLTEQAKTLRHRLAELIALIPANVLRESRDTTSDVGTLLSTPGEMQRGSTHEVARINFKRLQESLRSLEEFGKLIAPELASGIETLRYRAYTLERATRIGSDARAFLEGAKLYVLLTGSECLAALDWTIHEAAGGGATIFQLREKTLSDRELIARARNVREWTRETGSLFILNDRPDIARLVEADGVHLGQDDMNVREARRILGPGPLIGVSTHNVDQVSQAVMDGASYIGIGPTFPSKTKQFRELAGLKFVREAVARTSLPAFVIGGVTDENVGEVVAAGGKRVAVSAAICQAEEPQSAAGILVSMLPASDWSRS
ncbi:MAG: thiamine phosphate synthase [Gemmataceae bacterium]|nr:thiamine phosphate synthase [Gemmataceae bacterium]